MKKLVPYLIAIMASIILCGCASTKYNYKNHTNIGSQQLLQLQQADSDQEIRAVKPLENWVAKSAEIIIPNRKICQTLISNTFMQPRSVIDTLAESNHIRFDTRAEEIIKRNIFRITKKTEGNHGYPLETKNVII